MAGVHEARAAAAAAGNGNGNGRTPRRRRVLLFPLPFHGHINPMLQLGAALHARARGGLAVTVLHTRLNAPPPETVQRWRHPEFQFVPVPDGVPARVAASGDVIAIIEAMNAAMEADGAAPLRAVLESVVAADDAACIVFDANLLAVPSAAAAVGLKTLVLRTASAACLRCFMAYPMLHQNGYLPPQESKLDMPVKELPPLRVRDLFYSRWSDQKKMRDLLARAMEAMNSSSGVVINTLDALETAELKRLREELHIPMVLAAGPLHKLCSSNSNSNSTIRSTTSMLDHQDQDDDSSCIIEWLDRQPSESVLYVSFGSLASMDSKEFLEVAWGLANSGHHFLWVVRADSVRGLDGDDGPDLPDGFEAAVLGRGKVIRWAPQPAVLAHPAVGGFWTHCGWNSTLESISEGVPMICRPQFADQMMNTRYVVSTWGVGLELEGELERGRIEKAVRRLMEEKEGEEMRERAKELKKSVADCLKPGGTSQVAIDKLVSYILSM